MAGHAQRILDRFPSFMRTELPGKAINDVASAVGSQLDEAERLGNSIQRGHRIAVAAEERDILQLAALAGLERADFFILRKFYEKRYFAAAEKDVAVTFSGGKTGFDFLLKITAAGALNAIQSEIQSKLQALLATPPDVVSVRDVVDRLGRSALYRLRSAALVAVRSGDHAKLTKLALAVGAPQNAQDGEQRAYDAYLDRLRAAVQRVIQILLDGCGTIHALLEGTSVLLNAETTGEVSHVDAGQPRGGFIHRLPITYSLPQNGQFVSQQGFIYMIENPLTDKSTDNVERRQREEFRITRKGFFSEPVSVQITGIGGRTVLPRVVNETTHEGVGFRKVIKDGQTLLFSGNGKVSLDGADVTASSYYFRGALADFSKTDSKAKADLVPVSTPAGALDRNYPRPVITPATTLPVMTLPLGDSDWRFSVVEADFDASGFDESVFAPPAPSGPPSAVQAPSAKVELLWKEEKPFSVLILVPVELKPLEAQEWLGTDLRKLVRAGLERFRTAGIEVQVDYFDSKWLAAKT